ncbi:MAG: alkaline phosphatase family protein [Actinomycetota bacterium]
MLSKRVLVVAGLAVCVALVALYLLGPSGSVPAGAPSEDEMASSVGAPIMELISQGHVPDRSGELLLVPKPHSFLLGRPDLTLLGTDEPIPGSSHPNPWDYTVRVPIVLYGEGHVPAGERIDDPVDITGLAPTYARMLGTSFEADGEPLPGVEPAPRPPRAIVTVVMDGGGWNVLQQHPSSWPTIERLMREGTLYTNATIGSAPSITGALHATFGTGDYPAAHGIPGNQLRDEKGENVDAYLEEADPRYLRSPTIAELWDERNGNRPVVGTVSYEGWHLGMIGHGAQREGGDKDIAALWDVKKNEWWINEEYYELPSYLQETDLKRLQSYEEELDARDGIEDGRWFSDTIAEIQRPLEDLGHTTRPGTPAFVRFTGDAVADVLRNEDVGKDAVTDMIWVEMKMPDYAGHRWNMVSPEEADVLEETDTQIARLVRLLDEQVGRGNYVFGVSADHGQQPLPDVHGGWRINTAELEDDLESRFGPFIEKVTTVDLFVDRDYVEQEGLDLGRVASYLGTYTIGDNIPEGQPGADRVPEAILDDTIFAGAFSTDYIRALDDERIRSFGEGDYEEGKLVVEKRGPDG